MATTQDYGLGEFTFPRGWFMVADAEEISNEPLSVRFFGQDMVIYRGKSGRIVMLDAYCAHMGAHLGKNNTSFVIKRQQRMEGDSIRCPYHAWRYGPDGKCDDIPLHKGSIPKAACVKSWKIEERMGVIFAWYDPEGGEPDYEAPFLKEWEDPAFVHWKIDHLGVMSSHPQEVLDNMADMAHLEPTHGSGTPEFFENEFKDHILIQRQRSPRYMATDGSFVETDTWYTGPGILLSRNTSERHSIMLITHTPVDDGVIKVWHALLVKSPNAVATPDDVKDARVYQERLKYGFCQDFEVWANKRPCINVLQMPTDGPFHKVRAWYRQFYNPRARAAEFTKKVAGVHVTRSPQKVAAE